MNVKHTFRCLKCRLVSEVCRTHHSVLCLQDWWSGADSVLVLRGGVGPGEERRASELAVHVLDDRRHLRLGHGLGHHPTLRWVKTLTSRTDQNNATPAAMWVTFSSETVKFSSSQQTGRDFQKIHHRVLLERVILLMKNRLNSNRRREGELNDPVVIPEEQFVSAARWSDHRWAAGSVGMNICLEGLHQRSLCKYARGQTETMFLTQRK